MITIAEPYRLFAIEGDDALRARLRFAGADEGIIVAGSITPYRLRKVRLLNGAHTSFVSLAILAGCRTVREAVEHPAVGAFLRSALLDEIVPSVDVPGAEGFARDVLARFANPYLQHQLWDITLQGTTKFRVRVVPSILDYVRATGTVPRALALGFAGFLAFQRRRAAGRAPTRRTCGAGRCGRRIDPGALARASATTRPRSAAFVRADLRRYRAVGRRSRRDPGIRRRRDGASHDDSRARCGGRDRGARADSRAMSR